MRLLVIIFLLNYAWLFAQEPYLIVTGIAQDGGYPHAGCNKKCCINAWTDCSKRKYVSSVSLVDPLTGKIYLFDATPDFSEQLQLIRTRLNNPGILPSAIFLTHAHIGHYSGLISLGREVMGTSNIPVYAMPRMTTFLNSNGPWSQLVRLNNISLVQIENSQEITLPNHIRVKPFLVPHRDEYSETVGYSIQTGSAKYLYIPDIDKWTRLYPETTSASLIKLFSAYDYVLIDGTFFNNGELGNRDMSEIPHPFVVETMASLGNLDSTSKSHIYFIHLNHTNPLLFESPERDIVIKNGFRIAETGMELR